MRMSSIYPSKFKFHIMDNKLVFSDDSEIANRNTANQPGTQPGQSITETRSKTALFPPTTQQFVANSSQKEQNESTSKSKTPAPEGNPVPRTVEDQMSTEMNITTFTPAEQLRARAKAANLPPPDEENVSAISKAASYITTHGSVATALTDVGSFIRLQVKPSDPPEKTSDSGAGNSQETAPKLEEGADTAAKTAIEDKKYAVATHVIFDLDGTLLDTESINNRIIADIATEYDSEFSPEIQCRVMGRVASDASVTAVELMHLPLTAEEFAARVEAQNKELMSQVELMPGAERLIRHLSKNKVPIAVATSAGKDNYEIKSTRHKELFSLFHHIVTGGSDPEVTVGKPAPDIYLVAASRFPDKPKSSQCLAIEDSPNGVKAAVNAGMQVVMIPDPCTKPEYCQEATLLLKSMLDFNPELFGLPRFAEQ